MARAAAIAFLGTLATPAFAAGDGLEGAPWWFVAAIYVPLIAIAGLLAVGFGFFLQGLLRPRNALVVLTILFAGFLGWLAAVYGAEKTLHSLPEFALMLALFSPLLGLGWFIGMKDAGRRSNQTPALKAGSNHG
jgi:hypothetical protein